MRRDELAGLTVDELVARFVTIALGQHDALRVLDTARYNKLYDRMTVLERELKRREGDQRRALIPLFSHPNAQVRLKAASAALVLAPEPARLTLQQISDRNEYPEAAYARGMMEALDKGTFIPS